MPNVSPFRQHAHLLVSGLMSLLLYLYSMPKTVALEDDGLFILAAMKPGLAHPPGYPLYVGLGWLMQQLPGLSPAVAMHTLSALLGSLGVMLLAAIVFRLSQDRAVASSAALLMASGYLYWSQSLIADVYTLNVVFVLALSYLALSPKPLRVQRLWLAAFLYGLSLSNHIPLMLLLSPALLWLYLPHIRQHLGSLPLLVLWFVLGASPNLVLFSWSQTPGAFVVYGPVRDWQEWLDTLMRSSYATVDQNPAADWSDKQQYTVYWLRLMLHEYSTLFWVLLIPGLARLWRHHRHLTGFILLAILGNGLLLTLRLNFEFNPLYREVIKVYYLPVLAVSCIALGLGLLQLKEWLKPLPTGVLWAVLLGLPLSNTAAHWMDNDRHTDRWSETYFKILRQLVPATATLVVSDDVNTGTVGYLNQQLPASRQWQMRNANNLLFPQRYAHPLQTDRQNRTEWFEKISAEDEVYFTYDVDFIENKRCRWLVCQAAPDLTDGQVQNSYGRQSLSLLDSVLELSPKDPWSRIHHQKLLARAISWLMPLYQQAQGNERQQLRTLLWKLADTPANQIVLLDNLLVHGALEEFAALQQFVTFVEANSAELGKQKQAWYLYRLALWAKQNNRDPNALYQRSKSLFDHPGQLGD